ncbi:hypothetical protein [Symmachiella dynata]|uniref:hypothetical protein n=1 Tax=Symmachiella dynata TaxID=2527995 RepID=UPI0030EE54F6
MTPQLYHDLKQAAHDHTVSGEFVAIFGQQVSTISKGNHINVTLLLKSVDIEWIPLTPTDA